MTRQRYKKEESLNRIRNLLTGDTVATSDAPETLQGVLLNQEEALSDIAELMGNSLPSETPTLPAGFFASAAEANAGTAADRVMSPIRHSNAHEFGGIFVATGTTSISFTATSWNKVTGTFQYFMEDSGAEILCDWNDDRIVINETGDYLVQWQISFKVMRGVSATVMVDAFLNAVDQVQTRGGRITLGASGSYQQVSGLGFINVDTIGYAVDLRAYPSATAEIAVDSAELTVLRSVGG